MAFTFGTTAPTNNTTFGGFGTSQATTTPAFGAQTSTTPGFGSAPATGTTPFGSTTTTGFGTNANSGFGFGSTSTAPTTSTTGFAFGATSSAPTTSTTGFAFGNTSAAPATSTTGFSFGNTSAAPTTSTTGFSFGGTSTAPTTASTFGGFGTNTNTSLFGTTNNATGFGGFGANKPTTFGTSNTTSLFGNNNTTAFGQANTNTNQQRAQQVYQLLAQIDQEERARLAPSIYSEDYKPDNVWQALAIIKSWWDPKSPHCRFKHYFYNVVAPQEVPLYQKPADHDQAAWDAAQAANPDRAKMVPALAIGFDDIQKRIDEQHKMGQAHENKLIQIEALLKSIQKKSQLETAVKLNEYKRRHMQTVQRVIKFLKYAQVLRNKGLSITPDEEIMRSRLEDLQDQLQRSEQFHGRLSQLWAQLQLIKESGRKYGKIEGVDEWDAVSEENMSSITKILEEQDNGVQHIIDVLQTDSTEIDKLYKTWRGHQQPHHNY